MQKFKEVSKKCKITLNYNWFSFFVQILGREGKKVFLWTTLLLSKRGRNTTRVIFRDKMRGKSSSGEFANTIELPMPLSCCCRCCCSNGSFNTCVFSILLLLLFLRANVSCQLLNQRNLLKKRKTQVSSVNSGYIELAFKDIAPYRCKQKIPTYVLFNKFAATNNQKNILKPD